MPHRTSGMTYELNGDQNPLDRTDLAFKSPKRISITIPHNAYEYLVQRSDREGRSLSNLAAYLLESAQESNLGSSGSHF